MEKKNRRKIKPNKEKTLMLIFIFPKKTTALSPLAGAIVIINYV